MILVCHDWNVDSHQNDVVGITAVHVHPRIDGVRSFVFSL